MYSWPLTNLVCEAATEIASDIQQMLQSSTFSYPHQKYLGFRNDSMHPMSYLETC